MEHQLKIQSVYFEEVVKGNKTFEIRNNDRNFLIEDTVVLQELDFETGLPSGRDVKGLITYITNFQQKEGYVVFSFKLLEK